MAHEAMTTSGKSKRNGVARITALLFALIAIGILLGSKRSAEHRQVTPSDREQRQSSGSRRSPLHETRGFDIPVAAAETAVGTTSAQTPGSSESPPATSRTNWANHEYRDRQHQRRADPAAADEWVRRDERRELDRIASVVPLSDTEFDALARLFERTPYPDIEDLAAILGENRAGQCAAVLQKESEALVNAAIEALVDGFDGDLRLRDDQREMVQQTLRQYVQTFGASETPAVELTEGVGFDTRSPRAVARRSVRDDRHQHVEIRAAFAQQIASVLDPWQVQLLPGAMKRLGL